MKVTERIQLKPSSDLSKLCYLAKNLYNTANFHYRQFLFHLEERITYNDLDFILKSQPDYVALPPQTSQQILRLLIKNWKAYRKALKKFYINPRKFTGKPRPPKYKPKDGQSIAIFTNQNTRLKNGNEIHFPKKVNLPPIRTRIPHYNQIRILPQGYGYMMEIIYERDETDLLLNLNNYIGIDLGVNNLAAIVNNIGLPPILIKGSIVKSMNQFYNKRNAFLQSVKDQQEYDFQTKKQDRILRKRNHQIHNFFHHVSKYIIDYCIKHDIGNIVIGYNEGWKQKIDIGKTNNQNFVQLPFRKLVKQIEYKAELIGINVIRHEESYTSKCSFLDGEKVGKHTKYSGKRIRKITINKKKVKCNLFKRGNGRIVNGDINGALNILTKAVPNVFADGWAGLVLSPLSVRYGYTIKRKLTMIPIII